MADLQNKIDFVALIAVSGANPNGDPTAANEPRIDYDDFGEISDVCIKRKIRNRMQDLGHRVFVQSNDRCDDGFGSLSERASAELKGVKDRDEYVKKACETWLDVRSFGQVFAFRDKQGESIGVRGPVSLHQARSVSPVEVASFQITKSVNGSASSEKGKRTSDTMGMKHFVRFGLYEVKGSINVQLAQKTGFSQEDAGIVKECLRTLFVNDASSARPDGSMEVWKLFWWQHNCKDGQHSSAKVHRSVKVSLKDPDKLPHSVDDYSVVVEELEGLEPEAINGL